MIINFIKNIIPKIFSTLALIFRMVSNVLAYISYLSHKAFRTKTGLKLKQLDREIAEFKKLAQNQSKSVQVNNANAKLVNILNNGNKND